MNSSIDRPDGTLRAWLELGPERGRPEALERALAATRRVPQRPGWTLPERWLRVNRPLLAAAAAILIVVVAGIALFRPASNVGPQPSPTPAATAGAAAPTTAATAGPTPGASFMPTALMKTWVGVPHDFPGASDVVALTFRFEFGELIATTNFGKDYFDSSARVAGRNLIELTSVSNG